MNSEKILRGACIIGQSGGPTAVINASVLGAVQAALQSEYITGVLGAAYGITGILQEQISDLAQEDPADTGIRYGYAWAAAEALLSFLEANFIIKNRQVAVYVDFLEEKPRVYIRAGLSLTLAQILGIGLRTGVGAGKVLWRHRKTIIPPQEKTGALQKKGEANHGKQSSVE